MMLAFKMTEDAFLFTKPRKIVNEWEKAKMEILENVGRNSRDSYLNKKKTLKIFDKGQKKLQKMGLRELQKVNIINKSEKSIFFKLGYNFK